MSFDGQVTLTPSLLVGGPPSARKALDAVDNSTQWRGPPRHYMVAAPQAATPYSYQGGMADHPPKGRTTNSP